MKRNLLSKIKHTAIAIPLIFSLNTGKVEAQDYSDKFQFGINILQCKFGSSFKNKMQDYDLEVYDNWQDNFSPSGGSMKLYHNDYSDEVNYSVIQIEPFVHKKGLKIGFPVSFHPKKVLEAYYVDWWDDVVVSDLSLKGKFSAGISIDKKLFSFNIDEVPFFTSLGFQSEFGKYSLLKTDYKGKDCPNCQNSSVPVKSETIEKGNYYILSGEVLANFDALSGSDYYKFSMPIKFGLGVTFENFGKTNFWNFHIGAGVGIETKRK